MSRRRIAAIARRIVQQFRRDRPSLGLVFVAPIVVLALLGWVLRDQSPPSIRLGVVDQAPGGLVVALIRPAAASGGLQVVEFGNAPEAEASLRDESIDALILVSLAASPANPGVPAQTEVVTRGDDPADVAIAGQLQRLLFQAAFGGAGIPTVRTLYGSADADALDTFAPALIAFFGFFFVFILTGISFLRERIGGTLERLLATPVGRGEIVAGYSLGFALFATIQVALILAFSLSALEIPSIAGLPRVAIGLGIHSAGTPLLAFLVVLLLAIGAVNLGIFLSTFARTELQILQFIPIVIVPQALLGGVFWSIETLPGPLQPISRILPMTYAVEGLREVLIKGSGLAGGRLQLDLLVLALFAVLFVALAARTIRREVA
jgi:ABC-2 type transport system permease protein